MALRTAIAGTGFIGAVHAHAARAAGATLVGVAASSAESAQRAAALLGAEQAFASAEALAEAPDVDVVHICTPNHLHEDLAMRALAAGKHVVCEKPIAMDLDGAERLVDAAERAGTVNAVPLVYRFYPTVREARARLEGEPIHLVHGSYLQDWLLNAEDDNWRVDADLGGASRAFADIGSHWCDLAEFVTGQRIVRISARTKTALPERRRGEARAAFERSEDGAGSAVPVTTEDAAVIQFETDGGALGTAVISQVSAGRKNRLWLEVDGADEAIAFDQEQPEGLWVGRQDGASLLVRDPATLSPSAGRLAVLPAGHPQGYQDCFNLFVRDAYAAIETGQAPDGLPTFADGARSAQLIDSVLRSAAEQAWVDIAAVAGVRS
jgi:predicted dehydrogenase